MPHGSELANYYARRASEYEQIYHKPERRASIDWLNARLRQEFTGHAVMEAACGTGFWTQTIAEVAHSVVATDVNAAVLTLAAQKPMPPGKATFVQDDAYSLHNIPAGEFSAGFAGFWWSHLPQSQIAPFLGAFHSKLQPGAVILFADNLYVEGGSHPITRTDADGNTYQERVLLDGTRHEVLKNFPTEQKLAKAVEPYGSDFQFSSCDYYWCISYRLGTTARKSKQSA